MPAYLVTRINSVADPVKFGEYRTRVAATHARYGARYLAAGPGERFEGTAQPVATIVLEFPDMDAIKRWHDSPEYRELRELRAAAVDLEILAFEGM